MPPLPDRISQGFIEAVISGLTDFTLSYPDIGLPSDKLIPDLYDSPASLLLAFINNFKLHAGPEARLLIIVDEYDHFANDVLSTDRDAFCELTSTRETWFSQIKPCMFRNSRKLSQMQSSS